MPVRIILGIGVTVVGFAIAARRFHWLSRLIRAGKPDPSRTRGSVVPKAEAEVTEVAGQRKLLQWTVPGLAHFFTMWGFFVLASVYLEAYGVLFNPKFAIPFVGHWAVLGFLQAFFALAVLLEGGKPGSYGMTGNGASTVGPSPAPTASPSASASTMYGNARTASVSRASTESMTPPK